MVLQVGRDVASWLRAGDTPDAGGEAGRAGHPGTRAERRGQQGVPRDGRARVLQQGHRRPAARRGLGRRQNGSRGHHPGAVCA